MKHTVWSSDGALDVDLKHTIWSLDRALDVDPMDDTWASLWQNMLQVEWTDPKGPPDWVSDPNVCSSIKVILMLDHIHEECG